MRWELLWNPGLACERFAGKARQRQRLKKLRGTVAQHLLVGHIESLELLEAAQPLGVGTIYDIGANAGTWALLAKAVIPVATVEAFEPLGRHCAEFRNNLKSIAGVRLHQLALGSENTTALLRVTDYSDASSMLPLAEAGRSQFGVREVEQHKVEVRRLDDYRIERVLPFPDVMKIDVQGYELEVLKGATQCLHHTKGLVVELSFAEYYEGQCLFHEVVCFLAEFGLFLAVLGEHTRTGVALGQTDALFLKHV